MLSRTWDYLIVTASHEEQARAYEMQLGLRRELGLLADVGEVLVIPDPGGQRVGSAGSTLCCLAAVIEGRMRGVGRPSNTLLPGGEKTTFWREALDGLRILIVHAGGDSRRLPAYGPCGKILVPVPGESDRPVPMTLFDQQLPMYLGLPQPAEVAGGTDSPYADSVPSPSNSPLAANGKPPGQIVITAGDTLLRFDTKEVQFAAKGLTALACHAPPERAAHHGVLCRGAGDEVRLFLQKPSPDEQRAMGALDLYGQALLDIGVMSLDSGMAARLVELFGLTAGPDGRLMPGGELGEAVLHDGLDFYREICCALGAEVTFEVYLESVRRSGSKWGEGLLRRIFDGLRGIPFYVRSLPRCDFLHFGTTRQIISSGYALLQRDLGVASLNTCLDVGNEVTAGGQLGGSNAWVEGCRVRARLDLGGENAVVGVDVDEPLSLPRGGCVDVTPGRDRQGRSAWFVRAYGVNDTFKDTVAGGATICGRPVLDWLRVVGARPADVWGEGVDAQQQSIWDARLFPAVGSLGEYREWLWMLEPERATDEARRRWRTAERYSPAEIAGLADLEAFFSRRAQIRAGRLAASLRRVFRPESGFSASELGYLLRNAGDRVQWMAAVISEAHWQCQDPAAAGMGGGLVFSRIIHTLGTAVMELDAWHGRLVDDAWPGLIDRLSVQQRDWLEQVGLGLAKGRSIQDWAERARALAFESVGRVILSPSNGGREPFSRGAQVACAEKGFRLGEGSRPRFALRTDEIVWGRAPARLDMAGGWTDTPPYALEHGGSVVNVAVNLNGLPPIQAYARVVDEPVIRISSIDLGAKAELRELPELLDYRQAESGFALVKAALALSGLSPEMADWPAGITLREMLSALGGGIEITTLAAIPKGSGLGTSSIMGAVILAVVRRVFGQTLTPRELFNGVLQLEQALTTGGGWQDQVGGAVPGAKITSASPGLVPDPRIHYLPADVIDPRLNGGKTLLYYTGITRLAKGILAQVVGRYLDRDRLGMAALRRIGDLAPYMAEAVSGKDHARFGTLIGQAWELNKQLDPDSSNAEVEVLLRRIGPHAYGAKLLGAGGGGFLFIVCRSETDARRLRESLESDPANPRARFFDFQISDEGLVVTVC